MVKQKRRPVFSGIKAKSYEVELPQVSEPLVASGSVSFNQNLAVDKEAEYQLVYDEPVLEDSTLVYRVKRSPTKKVFYIDVGTMPPERVKAYLEKVKQEIKQRRIQEEPKILGYKGKMTVDAGYFYCPYIPLQGT